MINHKRYCVIVVILLSMVLLSNLYRPEPVRGQINFTKLGNGIQGWQFFSDIDVDYKAYTALDPNTLIFRNFKNGKGNIANLVVVYHQNNRWGAHDPMICYTSQGWAIKEKTDIVKIPFQGNFTELNRFMASKGDTLNLVYYCWFSSNRKITSSRNKQMIEMVLNGVIHGYTESGFLRFSMVINENNPEETIADLNDFTGKFLEDFIHPQ
jgi:EpsI family protein